MTGARALIAAGLCALGLANCAARAVQVTPVVGKAQIHVFSEGYLSGGTGVDTTALRDASGQWTIVTRNGFPGHWSSPKSHVLSRAQATALESVLDEPASYVDEPGPEEADHCVDPWSIRIEWSWRSRTGMLYQQCGPWGAAERISQLLAEPAR